MTKTKLLIIGLFAVVFLFFVSSQILAQTRCVPNTACPTGARVESCCPTEGLVPCGSPCCACQICDIFRLIDTIVDFLLFNLVPPLALLMLIIGGGMFALAGGNPQTIITARKLITNVFIGILIIYGAYTLVGVFLQSIGLAQWTENIYRSWWQDGLFTIPCG